MDVLSFKTEIRRLIELRQEGEYWDFKKEWYQNKSDLLHDIILQIPIKRSEFSEMNGVPVPM